MQAHSTIRKTIQYAHDIRFYTSIMLIVIICIFIFSFVTQQLYTNERNQGRDIRTNADYLLTEMFEMRTNVALIFLGEQSRNPVDVSSLKEDRSVIDRYHEYIKEHSINMQAYHIFLSNEQTYAIIINWVQLFSNKTHVISETEFRLFAVYTNTYGSAIVKFKSIYTQMFVINNNAASTYSLGELISELVLFALLFFLIIVRTLDKFIESAEKSDELQKELLDTRLEVSRVVRSYSDSVTIPRDVACLDKYKYTVANHGRTQNVYYDEKTRMFICDCRMFLQSRSCYHVNRAKQLHNRIYRANVS